MAVQRVKEVPCTCMAMNIMVEMGLSALRYVTCLNEICHQYVKKFCSIPVVNLR